MPLTTNINKKIFLVASIIILILTCNTGFTSVSGKLQNFESRITNDGPHTILAEEVTTSKCGSCPPVVGYMDEIYNSENYDFYYVTLVYDKNTYTKSRVNEELHVEGVPTVVFDGGYNKVAGNKGSTTPYINAIDGCEERKVPDVDLNIYVKWLGNAEMSIDVDVKNNQALKYEGHLHVYITEINSRWYCKGSTQYHFAMIGDYAINQDISVGASSSWSDTVKWDGNNYGFGDITIDNIMVIASIFNQNNDYNDETAAAYPQSNTAPTVSDIPDQTINQGNSFSTINLDDYVSDIEDPDSSISWSYSSTYGLIISIENRIATISVPNQNWHGTEEITFTATDTGDLSDSDSARFTVVEDKDPPIVSNIPGQTIEKGESFDVINLDDYVNDKEDPKSAITWTYSGNEDLTVSIINRVATISTPNPNWLGSETITFTATDTDEMSDSDDVTFRVSGGNDPPNKPSNPSPSDGETNIDADNILCWSGGDPNPDDTVTYDVYLDKNNPPTTKVSERQTQNKYTPDLEYNTTYYWKIVAWDDHDVKTEGVIWSFTTGENLQTPLKLSIMPNKICVGQVKFNIKNEDERTFSDVDLDIHVKNRRIGPINLNEQKTIDTLEKGDTESISTNPGSIKYGFGILDIHVYIELGSNDIDYDFEAYVLGPFVYFP